MGVGAPRLEIRRAVIALDDGQRAAPLEHALQALEGLRHPRKMLEDEAHEHVVERLASKRQRVEIHSLEADVGRLHPLPGDGRRLGRDVDRDERRVGTPRRQGDGLGADATSRLEDQAAWPIERVGVQELRQRRRLSDEPGLLAVRVAVHVRALVRHGALRG